MVHVETKSDMTEDTTTTRTRDRDPTGQGYNRDLTDPAETGPRQSEPIEDMSRMPLRSEI